MSHDAVNASPHTQCNPAIFVVYKLVYGQARTRECVIITTMPSATKTDEGICNGLGLWIHGHQRTGNRQFGWRST